ncbi:AAA family ATPase [Hoeflea sp. TYP-13]|uniref:AAA family ATPase n=1 Tax=Hoeflea sp. TYP-13 TaxID=3230023 RepID=UPI0034C5C907
MTKTAILVGGLPASGKTTVGWTVAHLLDIPCLDKDDFLEELFEQRGIGDQAWRRQLSNESNDLFEAEARRYDFVVLVSHWQSAATPGSGTPTAWVKEAFQRIIELNCICPPDIAARRFTGRNRHPGHLDAERTYDEVAAWMSGMAEGYPLGVGRLVNVRTDIGIGEAALITEIRSLLVVGAG